MSSTVIALVCLMSLGPTQPRIRCPKLTIKTLEQGVKYVHS